MLAALATLHTTGCAAPRPIEAVKAPQPADGGATAEAAKPFEADLRHTASASQAGMTCRLATATARGALLRLGYEVIETRPPTPEQPGQLRAVKHTGWVTGDAGTDHHAVVELRCDNSGAEFTALTDEPLFGRLAFRREFPALIAAVAARRVNRPRASAQTVPEARLAIHVEPLRDGGRSIFGEDLTAVGITPVHVLIRNGTSQTYSFEVARLQLVTQERQRRQAIPLADVEARITASGGAAVAARALNDGRIEPGGEVDGFLFFPASTYRRANAVLIDSESEEAEGFSIEF